MSIKGPSIALSGAAPAGPMITAAALSSSPASASFNAAVGGGTALPLLVAAGLGAFGKEVYDAEISHRLRAYAGARVRSNARSLEHMRAAGGQRANPEDNGSNHNNYDALESLKESNYELRTSIDELNKALVQKEEELETSKSEKAILECKLLEARKHKPREEAPSGESEELESLREELARKEEQRLEAKRLFEESKEQMKEEMKKLSSDLQQALTNAETHEEETKAKAQAELDALRAKHEGEIAKLETRHAAEMEVLKREVEKLTREMKEKEEAANDDADNNLSTAEETLEALEAQLKQAVEAHEAQAEAHAREKRELQAKHAEEVAALSLHLTRRKKASQTYQEALKFYPKTIDNLQEDTRNLRASLEEAEEKLDTEKQQNTILSEEYEKLKTEMAILRSQIDDNNKEEPSSNTINEKAYQEFLKNRSLGKRF